MKQPKEIIYLKHPVSPEEKARHIKAGKQILDIKFAPEGYGEKKPETKKTKA